MIDEREEDHAAGAPPRFDLDTYAELLGDTEIGQEQAQAFLETLWTVMAMFVDMGFDLNPDQEICGQVLPLDSHTGRTAADMISSPNSRNAFDRSARGGREGGRHERDA